MSRFVNRRMLSVVLALTCLSALSSTHTWKGPANGNWSDVNNWTGGIPTSGESGGTIVQFNGGTTSIMNINGLIVDQIVFTGNNNVIGGTGGIKLTISSNVLGANINNVSGTGNALDFSLPVGLTGTNDIFFVAAAGSMTLKSTISGTNNVRISTAAGAQVSYLGSKTYTGITGISAGTLLLSSVGTDNAVAGDIVIGTGSGSGATLKLVFGFEIANTSNVTVNSDGTFDLNNQGETIGALAVNGGSALIGSGNLSYSGALDMAGGTISGTSVFSLGSAVSATSSSIDSARITCPVSIAARARSQLTTGPRRGILSSPMSSLNARPVRY